MSNPHSSNSEVTLPLTQLNKKRKRHILTPSQFFTSLTTLLSTQSQKSKGSIYLTQKRFPSPPSEQQSETQSTPSILIRATDGKDKDSRTKVSTVVSPDELEAFYARYAEVCKGGMVGMKKRDRSAKKKGKKGRGAAGGKVTKQ